MRPSPWKSHGEFELVWSGGIHVFIYFGGFVSVKEVEKKEFRHCERMIHPARGISHVFEVFLEVCVQN